MENFTLKEIVLEIQKDVKELKNILPDHYENTQFRKKVITAIVGTAFLALSALGLAVLKITGIIHLGK